MNNLISLLNHANPYQFESGIHWYEEAREFAYDISRTFDKPLISAAAVIAALSPMLGWERNKIEAIEVLRGNKSYKFSSFKANVRKAFSLVNETDYSTIMTILNGRKTQSFFDNIYNPHSQLVTVDRHILSIHAGKKLGNKAKVNKSIYDEVENSIIKLADKFRLRPYELQAILWVTWRETV